MHRNRSRSVAVATVVGVVVLSAASQPVARAAVGASTAQRSSTSYLVVAKDVTSLAAARAAVAASGGTVTSQDAALGVLTATSARADFATAADGRAAILGVARNRVIGSLPKTDAAKADLVGATAAASATHPDPGPKAEPLSGLQWDMKAIGATTTGSYARQQGSRRVLVGVLDSGIDGNHPDIRANFDEGLSRNFVTDIPALDGPCEHPSCVDPVNEDDNGHGTHVAGTIGSPINGIGIAGVAPNVTLVTIRVAQDAGFIFLGPTLKALHYAADIGVDVVNMSFFIDPWLYNCTANPADSPTQRAEQRGIIAATQRALSYAHRRRVTLVAALGNEHTDLGKPGQDTTSPDYPPGTEHPRTIDNATCLNLPAEGENVISVSSVGPSGKKADYSNYGLEQNDVSAPGGFYRDHAGTPAGKTPGNLVLGPMPHNVALLSGSVNPTTGASTDPFVIASCSSPGPANCAYWQYLQGTSMASPHAAGVAALIVSQYGHRSRDGLTMQPDDVAEVLKRSATGVACPAAVITYTAEGRGPEFNAPCVGSASRNSIYGHGVVNALEAVSYTEGRRA